MLLHGNFVTTFTWGQCMVVSLSTQDSTACDGWSTNARAPEEVLMLARSKALEGRCHFCALCLRTHAQSPLRSQCDAP
eukprot:4973660-Amphidinium_carterae.2